MQIIINNDTVSAAPLCFVMIAPVFFYYCLRTLLLDQEINVFNTCQFRKSDYALKQAILYNKNGSKSSSLLKGSKGQIKKSDQLQKKQNRSSSLLNLYIKAKNSVKLPKQLKINSQKKSRNDKKSDVYSSHEGRKSWRSSKYELLNAMCLETIHEDIQQYQQVLV